MFTASYVGRKLITVSTAVATNVALKGVAKSMASHVDGEHDIVQKDHPAVAAGVNGPRKRPGLPVSPHHTQSLKWRQRNGLGMWVRAAVLVVQAPQQVSQAVQHGLGAVSVEGVQTERWLVGRIEAQYAHFVAVS